MVVHGVFIEVPSFLTLLLMCELCLIKTHFI